MNCARALKPATAAEVIIVYNDQLAFLPPEQAMRIIHTSDWHLGQNFYTRSRAPEHQAFLDWLLAMVATHQIDAIVVAGDIFDTGSPPSYAREIYNRFVVALQHTGCALYVLGGNHDSVATLNESRELLACLNTHVIASAQTDTGHQALEIPMRNGNPGAILCPIPFLRPRDILYSQAGQSGHEKQQALGEAIASHYQQCFAAAQTLKGERLLPIIATGHLTTVGVTKSESVRDIYIGTLDAFPAHCFPAADYIALGHIHRAQMVGGLEHIRYSGSPLALSFDEVGKTKTVNLVSFEQGKLAEITPLEVPVTQPLMTIKGALAEIISRLKAWPVDGPMTWLDIEIVTDEYLHDLQRQVQTLTEHLPVEVLLLRRSREQRQKTIERQHKETLSELSVEEVFERRLALEDIDNDQAGRLRQLFALTRETLHQEPEA